MKRALAAAVAALACLGGAVQATEWPGGRRAAIVLTYDDALTSQLDVAAPQLDAAGLKATFFLSRPKEADLLRWRALARNGHELGNHTTNHPCSAASYPAPASRTSETYTVQAMLGEIVQMNAILAAIDGRTGRRGYATPCGQRHAGNQDYIEPLRAAGLVSYVRAASASPEDLRLEPAGIDLFNVPAAGFRDDVAAAEVIDWVKRVEAAGGLGVLFFHGVGGDYLRISAEAHQQVLDHLKSREKEIWVAPLQQVLDRTGR